jgi:hypothetical protein
MNNNFTVNSRNVSQYYKIPTVINVNIKSSNNIMQNNSTISTKNNNKIN